MDLSYTWGQDPLQGRSGDSPGSLQSWGMELCKHPSPTGQEVPFEGQNTELG